MNEAAGFPDVRGFDTKDKHREESLSGPLFIGVNILPAGPVYLLVKIYILLWTQPWKQKNNHPSGICVICTRNHEITTSSVFFRNIENIYVWVYFSYWNYALHKNHSLLFASVFFLSYVNRCMQMENLI